MGFFDKMQESTYEARYASDTPEDTAQEKKKELRRKRIYRVYSAVEAIKTLICKSACDGSDSIWIDQMDIFKLIGGDLGELKAHMRSIVMAFEDEGFTAEMDHCRGYQDGYILISWK
jgi:hypothetical protein